MIALTVAGSIAEHIGFPTPFDFIDRLVADTDFTALDFATRDRDAIERPARRSGVAEVTVTARAIACATSAREPDNWRDAIACAHVRSKRAPRYRAGSMIASPAATT